MRLRQSPKNLCWMRKWIYNLQMAMDINKGIGQIGRHFKKLLEINLILKFFRFFAGSVNAPWPFSNLRYFGVNFKLKKIIF